MSHSTSCKADAARMVFEKDTLRARRVSHSPAPYASAILAHGFLRLCCGDCGNDKLLAFSCKRRGFCPSCGARRMSQTAAHLVHHVIPHVPVREWV
jgi:uncharacterized protein (DUF983 family)